VITVQGIPAKIKEGQDQYSHFLNRNHRITRESPTRGCHHAGVVGADRQGDLAGFNTSKDDKAVPREIRTYMSDSLPRYTEMKKQADDLLATAKALGELKLDTLRDAIHQNNPILIRGEKECGSFPTTKYGRLIRATCARQRRDPQAAVSPASR